MIMEFIPGGDLYNSFHVRDESLIAERKNWKQERTQYQENWGDFISNLGRYDEEQKQKMFASFEEQKRKIDQTDLEIAEKQFQLDKSIPFDLKMRMIFDVASGMNSLHSFNPPIVHRDLRSPNVFVRVNYWVKILFLFFWKRH